MVRKFIVLVLLATVLAGGFGGTARAEGQIAIVSLQRALNDVEEGKKIKATLKKDFEVKKKEIDTMKDNVEKLSKDLEGQELVLSQDAKKTKAGDIQAKFMDLQNKAATFERELKTKEAESARKILDKLRIIVNTIAAKEGYSLVLENSADVVLYSKDAVDITNSVISAYNSGK